MISVIDRTLSVVNVTGEPEAVRAFIAELFAVGVNIVELSEELYLRLDRKLPRGKYILRLGRSIDAGRYPEIHRFVASGVAVTNVTTSEDYFVREGDSILEGMTAPILRPIRLCLKAEPEMTDPQTIFSSLRETFLGHIEFSPRGVTGVATMLTAEWILGDGNCAVVTLGGIGGYASLEDVLGFLAAIRRRRSYADKSAFERLAAHLSLVVSEELVFDPETLLLGTMSSCHAVKFKLERLGYTISAEKLKALTVLVRMESERLGAPLGDSALHAICRDNL